MGKNRSHARPPRMPEMPKMNIQATLFPASYSFFIHKPHKIPHRAVATAGMVLQIPSGSQVLDDFHKWVVVSKVRSIQAPSLVSVSKLGTPIPQNGKQVQPRK